MQEYGRKDKQLLYYWVVWISRWLTFILHLHLAAAACERAAFRQNFMFYLIVQCPLLHGVRGVFTEVAASISGPSSAWSAPCESGSVRL
ncbi:hypothetical protein PINS_up017568 [Pythium insidiosum]|nr:hypothetical protein PINS_up017568 [Pythium insidiosum]